MTPLRIAVVGCGFWSRFQIPAWREIAGIECAGEDVATVFLKMRNGTTVTCNLSFASRLELERFPETVILVECNRGSVELAPSAGFGRPAETTGEDNLRTLQLVFAAYASARFGEVVKLADG